MQYRPNRIQTKQKAMLLVEGEAMHATIIDISRDGAKLKVPYSILEGTAVRLRLGPNDTKALVHWCHDGRAGIRFFDRLDRNTLTMIEYSEDAAPD
ncbi:MAG: PilZ domain-containing protein [Boseongicola sp.]